MWAAKGSRLPQFTPNVSDLEVGAAQKVIDHISSAELVRFTCSGTDANSSALRAARVYTERPQYVRFNGHYHGGNDDLMGGILGDPRNPYPVMDELENDIYSQFTNTYGRHPQAFNQVFMIEWNDLQALEKLFKRHGDEIAAVIISRPWSIISAACQSQVTWKVCVSCARNMVLY